MLPVISIESAEAAEGVPVIFTVTLSEASTGNVTVQYRTVQDGSGVGDVDYDEIIGTLTILAGQTVATISIDTYSDGIDEDDLNFTLKLSDPVNAVLAGGEPTLTATGVILDNDGASADRALFVSDPTITEDSLGTRVVLFEVRISEPSSTALTFNFETANGTATAGQDYVARTGTVTFASGQTVATVAVTLLGDAVMESSETFSLIVTPTAAIANGTADSTGIATILNYNNQPINGDSGPNTIYGTVLSDVINGLAGNDIIFGNTGFDTLLGGTGFDALYGEDGNDSLYGGAQADNLYGGNGFDLLYGEDGNDRLFGGFQADNLFGGTGSDVLYGEGGNDRLFGGDHSDELFAGTGNDVVYGESGGDRLFGDNGSDTLFGGTGNDFLSGGDLADILWGGFDSDTLEGGNGNDRLFGEHGNDTLHGDSQFGPSGNDELSGGSGYDTLTGGMGNDILSGGFNWDYFIFGGAFGADTILDFEEFNPFEKLDLRGVSTIDNFADLIANHLTQSGANAIIDAGGGNVITLLNVNIVDLDVTNFVL